MSNVHDLINKERKQRHLPHVYWSREMAKLAQSQANYCARVGRLVHSKRFAFKGGENLAEGGGRFPPKAIVDCWMSSHQGHREYLLSPRVTKAGVGIKKSHGKTFAAWAFSDETPSYPDCPAMKHKGRTSLNLARLLRLRGGKITMSPVKLCFSIILGCFGLIGILMGAHGIYVYFNRLSLLFSGEGQKLFLAMDVPIRLRPLVEWSSERGLQSWIIPALIFIAGLWLLSYSRLWSLISAGLNKIRP
jgi:hypothetical protein